MRAFNRSSVPTSKHWIRMGASALVRAWRSSAATKASSIGRSRAAKWDGCFSSGATPMTRPARAPASRAISTTSSKVRIGSCPSKAAEAGRRAGRRSRARRVFSSARVKSSVNQPVMGTPSTARVVRRSANSGRSAMSVVSSISFS